VLAGEKDGTNVSGEATEATLRLKCSSKDPLNKAQMDIGVWMREREKIKSGSLDRGTYFENRNIDVTGSMKPAVRVGTNRTGCHRLVCWSSGSRSKLDTLAFILPLRRRGCHHGDKRANQAVDVEWQAF